MKPRKAYGKIGVTLVLVIAMMLLIGSFSAQTGEQSGGLSDKVTAWLLDTLYPSGHALDAAAYASLFHTLAFLIRKGGHLTEFALLGVSLTLHVEAIHAYRPFRVRHAVAAVVGVVYAASDELHQMFVEGRSPQATDVLIDSCGVLLGVAATALLIGWLRRRRAKRCATPET